MSSIHEGEGRGGVACGRDRLDERKRGMRNKKHIKDNNDKRRWEGERIKSKEKNWKDKENYWKDKEKNWKNKENNWKDKENNWKNKDNNWKDKEKKWKDKELEE